MEGLQGSESPTRPELVEASLLETALIPDFLPAKTR